MTRNEDLVDSNSSIDNDDVLVVGVCHNIFNFNQNLSLTIPFYIIDNYFQSNDKAPISFTIGRSIKSDIKVTHDKRISGLHCLIRIEDFKNNRLSIENISRHGMYINDKLYNNNDGKILIKTNDILKIGIQEYIFKFEEFNSHPKVKSYLRNSNDFNNPKTIFDDYLFNEKDLLGSGNFGQVFKARSIKNNQIVAIKVIQIPISQSNNNKMVDKEISTLQKCQNHPNVMKILGHYSHQGKDFKNRLIINRFLILEFIDGGDLFELIGKSPNHKIPEFEMKYYFKQIIEGLKHLHKNDIIHRDIKLENIMLKIQNPQFNNYKKFQVKIADFGLSKYLGEVEFAKTVCGTPQYVAPEVINSEFVYVGKPVDLWSCGILLFTGCFGYFPFFKDDMKRNKINHVNNDFGNLSIEVINLYENLLLVDPNFRFTCDDTLNHPWFMESFEDENFYNNNHNDDIFMEPVEINSNPPTQPDFTPPEFQLAQEIMNSPSEYQSFHNQQLNVKSSFEKYTFGSLKLEEEFLP